MFSDISCFEKHNLPSHFECATIKVLKRTALPHNTANIIGSHVIPHNPGPFQLREFKKCKFSAMPGSVCTPLSGNWLLGRQYQQQVAHSLTYRCVWQKTGLSWLYMQSGNQEPKHHLCTSYSFCIWQRCGQQPQQKTGSATSQDISVWAEHLVPVSHITKTGVSSSDKNVCMS